MNYTVLNDNDFFKDIEIDNFKEVSIDGRERVDGIFGTITSKLLEDSDKFVGERNYLFREQWLCGDSGTVFMVFRIPQNILYDGTGQSLERCLGFFNPENVYVEIWSIKLQDKENTYEYFLIGYNKNLGFKCLTKKEFLEKKENEIVPFICSTIKEKIL